MVLSRQQRHCLQYMGVDIWVERGTDMASILPGEGARSAATEHDVADPQAAGKIAATEILPDEGARSAATEHDAAEPQVAGETAATEEVWQTLRAEVAGCRLCPLHTSRSQTVFGVGDVHAQWLLIGEAPGSEEDRQGEPFVGRAGKLLDSMLYAMKLGREQVFIANILKCRPPANRDPEPAEVAACEGYLQRQIALIQPRIILALGRVAAQQLLKVDTPVGKLRGIRHHYQMSTQSIPLVVTWHPAYLLRRPAEKARAWDDLQAAMAWFKDLQ